MRISDWSSDVCSSDLTPRTSAWLRELLADVFPPDRVAVALGDATLGAAFSALPFDHLVFTGSTAVGRKVMAAAAPNLTPLALELGGKSPAIVAADFPIEQAAARLATGKWLNSGQTRSEEHTSELQSLMRSSYAVFCLTKK